MAEANCKEVSEAPNLGDEEVDSMQEITPQQES